jgi:6-pyruvoyltetrahydropterin/6-carboxytetrahydropterin synthase
MTTVHLSRTVRFSAAHRYFRPDWSDRENARVFGDCTNDHGHSYDCCVTVVGPVAEGTSMVVDLATLDEILRHEVVERMDHKHLNHAVDEFAYGNTVPTAEAVAVYLWRKIEDRLPDGISLHRVRIQEDPLLFAEYFGP